MQTPWAAIFIWIVFGREASPLLKRCSKEPGHAYHSADREKHSGHWRCSVLFWVGPFSDSSLCIGANENGAWGKICILDFRASRLFSLSLFITFLRHYTTSSGGFGKGCTNRLRWNDRVRRRARIIWHLQIALPPFALLVALKFWTQVCVCLLPSTASLSWLGFVMGLSAHRQDSALKEESKWVLASKPWYGMHILGFADFMPCASLTCLKVGATTACLFFSVSAVSVAQWHSRLLTTPAIQWRLARLTPPPSLTCTELVRCAISIFKHGRPDFGVRRRRMNSAVYSLILFQFAEWGVPGPAVWFRSLGAVFSFFKQALLFSSFLCPWVCVPVSLKQERKKHIMGRPRSR